MIGLIKKLIGDKATRDAKAVTPYVNKIKEAYEHIKTLTNDELREKTALFKKQIADYVADEEKEIARLNHELDDNFTMEIQEKEKIYNQLDKLKAQSYEKTQEILDQLLPEAFAVVKETARRFKDNPEVVVTANDWDRALATVYENVSIQGDKAIYKNQWLAGGNLITWDMVHYDVQLFGGVVLHQGKIAEMATGEGKTLVATLPVYLNALPGKGVHVVTVNDYLAKRDSEWMGMLLMFHGLKVDCIDKHEPNTTARREAYLADVTY